MYRNEPFGFYSKRNNAINTNEMEEKNYNEMSNSELKLLLVQIENEFEIKKAKIIEICDELDKLNFKYEKINNELNLRKNIFA